MSIKVSNAMRVASSILQKITGTEKQRFSNSRSYKLLLKIRQLSRHFIQVCFAKPHKPLDGIM